MHDYTNSQMSAKNKSIISYYPDRAPSAVINVRPKFPDIQLTCEEEVQTGISTPLNQVFMVENSIIGIDTVHMKFPIMIPDHLLVIPWEQRTARRNNKSLKVWYIRKHFINGAKIFMKYYPVGYEGKALLVIEISSLPQFIYGDNLKPITDLPEAIEILNDMFDQLLPDIQIDLGDGILEHIDIFYDHFVGEFVYEHLEAISKLYHPRWSRAVYSNQPKHDRNKGNGIIFKCNDYQCVFYNQELKRGAYGLLRQEARLLDTDAITKSTGLSKPTLRGITSNIVFNILKRDLERLGLWKTSISGGNLALDTLMQYYPANKAHRLFYILTVIRDHLMMDKKEIASTLGIGTWTLNRSLKEINEAGITPSLIDRDMLLPPLSLPLPGGEMSEISPKVPSDTELVPSSLAHDQIRLLQRVIK